MIFTMDLFSGHTLAQGLGFHDLEKVAFYLFRKIFYVFMNVSPNFGKTLLTSNGIPVITVK